LTKPLRYINAVDTESHFVALHRMAWLTEKIASIITPRHPHARGVTNGKSTLENERLVRQ
jgi:hypothetical protein